MTDYSNNLFLVRRRSDWSQYVGSIAWVLAGLGVWDVSNRELGEVRVAVREGRLDDVVELLGSYGIDFVVCDWLKEINDD